MLRGAAAADGRDELRGGSRCIKFLNRVMMEFLNSTGVSICEN